MMLILLICFYMIVAHWLACIWYHIGRSDAENGLRHSWLWKLGNVTQVSSLPPEPQRPPQANERASERASERQQTHLPCISSTHKQVGTFRRRVPILTAFPLNAALMFARTWPAATAADVACSGAATCNGPLARTHARARAVTFRAHQQKHDFSARACRRPNQMDDVHFGVVFHNDLHDVRRLWKRVARDRQRKNVHDNNDDNWR